MCGSFNKQMLTFSDNNMIRAAEGSGEKLSCKNIVGIVNHNKAVRCTSKCLSILTVKALLIILPKCSLIAPRQCNGKQKKRKQREDAAQKGKIHENKSFMGLLKSLGAPGKHPLFHPTFGIAESISLLQGCHCERDPDVQRLEFYTYQYHSLVHWKCFCEHRNFECTNVAMS